MTIGDVLPAASIVLLVLFALLGLLFLWEGLKPRPKPAPEPWDGEHQMKRLQHHRYWGDHPSEYTEGWIWECACGVGGTSPLWRLPHTAEEAVEEFLRHKRLIKKLENGG